MRNVLSGVFGNIVAKNIGHNQNSQRTYRRWRQSRLDRGQSDTYLVLTREKQQRSRNISTPNALLFIDKIACTNVRRFRKYSACSPIIVNIYLYIENRYTLYGKIRAWFLVFVWAAILAWTYCASFCIYCAYCIMYIMCFIRISSCQVLRRVVERAEDRKVGRYRKW